MLEDPRFTARWWQVLGRSGDSLWKSPKRVVGLYKEGEEGTPSKGRNTLSPILFSLSSEDNVEPEGTPVSHVTQRSHSWGLLVFFISLQ